MTLFLFLFEKKGGEKEEEAFVTITATHNLGLESVPLLSPFSPTVRVR